MDHLQSMRAFVRLVELGSFSEVARELHVGQPTISKWIAQLEADLGRPLVARTSRSIGVTTAGRALHERMVDVIEAYDAAIDSVEGAQLRGTLRLNLPVVFGTRYVVPIVSSFSNMNPHVEIDLEFSDSYDALVEHGFDLAIRLGVLDDSSLQKHQLARGKRALVAAPGYLRDAPELRTPQDLGQHACLVHTQHGASARWTIGHKGRTAKHSVRGPFRLNNSAAALELAKRGHGIALLARWLVEDDLARGTLVQVLPDATLPAAPVVALTPPGRRLSRPVLTFLQHVKAELEM